MPSRLWAIVAVTVFVVFVSNWVSLGTVRQSCTEWQAAGVADYKAGCQYGGPGYPYQINSYGIPNDEPGRVSTPDQIDVLYIGWTEPLTISEFPLDRRVAHLLEKELDSQIGPNKKTRVIDGSSPGIDGGLSAEKIVRLVRAYHPKIVVFLFQPQLGYLRDASYSYLDLQIRLAQLSWKSRLSHNQTETLMRPMLAEISRLSEMTSSLGADFVFVWSGTGLQSRQWGQRFPRTAEGFISLLLTTMVTPVQLTPADVGQFLSLEVPDLTEVKQVAHLFYGGRPWPPVQSEKIAARLAEVLVPRILKAH